MCKIVTERGMEEIGDPKEMPLYGYSIALEADHDPHWDPRDIQTDTGIDSLILVVKGLPMRITPEEEVVILKGRASRGEHF